MCHVLPIRAQILQHANSKCQMDIHNNRMEELDKGLCIFLPNGERWLHIIGIILVHILKHANSKCQMDINNYRMARPDSGLCIFTPNAKRW